MNRRPCLAALAAAAAVAGGVACAPHAPPLGLGDADRAFIAHDLRQADALYGDVAAADSLPGRDRAEALRHRATIAWRFAGQADSGRRLLARALALGVDSAATLTERARLETAAGRPDSAVRAARAALGTARSAEDRLHAMVELAAAVVTPVRDALLERGRWPDAAARDRLRSVLAGLRRLNAAEPGLLESSRWQLEAALLLDDGPAALAAWRSYYLLHLARSGPLPAALDTLARVLLAWSGTQATDAGRAAAVRALAASGQYDAALILATDPRAASRLDTIPAVADVMAWMQTLRRVRVLTEAYYRATALGAGDADAFRTALFAEAERLWGELTWPGAAPPFDRDSVAGELRRRFGADLRLGTTAGYFDLHLGQIVVEERRSVEQYGQRIDVRFLALDGMVSNGFQSWAWDGRQAHGGWVESGAIVQVRPQYVTGPLRAWRMLTDSVERRRQLERQAADSVADAARARRDPVGYLPGLAARMRAQGLLALRDSLRDAGLRGDALRDAFLPAYDDAVVESSVFAHEGRHAIDRALQLSIAVWEREYHAKLSEVAFAPRPRLALSAILNPNIGDRTPHGRANRRVMEGLVGWMETHAAEIPGLDTTRPLLPQLSLLTDPQLRRAFRSMDPLANGAGAEPQ